MTEVSPFLSVIILNVNELNFPLKTKVSIRDETHHPNIRDLLEIQRHNILKVKGWKKISHANSNQKRVGVSILISDKIDFK